jgi:hypothetical protein
VWNLNPFAPTNALIQQANSLLQSLITKVTNMANSTDLAITKLQGDVTSLTTVVSSATALINGFAAQLAAAIAAAQAAGATPAELQALSDLSTAIVAQGASLAAAVTANTPPAPTGPTGP